MRDVLKRGVVGLAVDIHGNGWFCGRRFENFLARYGDCGSPLGVLWEVLYGVCGAASPLAPQCGQV